MNWESVNFGIGTRVVPRNKSVSNVAPTQLSIPDPKRIGVIISGPLTNPLFIHFGDNPVLGQGLRIATVEKPLCVWIADYGELPRLAIWASINVAAENIEYYEIYKDNLYATEGNR